MQHQPAIMFSRKSLAGLSCLYGKALFFIVLLFIFTTAFPVQLSAQVESDERPLLVSPNGLVFHKDSVFLLNVRFRMQNRFGYFSKLDQSDEPGFETLIRRVRLRFDGFVVSPKVSYYLQLSFSRSDQDLVSGTIAQTVRDAMVYYNVNKNFYFGLGQSKLPGNRERVISSGNLQMPDRSIANSVYTLDRDAGLFAYGQIPVGKQMIMYKAAITGGEGRGQNYSNDGLSYTGRIEYLPFGTFKNLGDYSEGDLEVEKSPKLSVGFSYNVNEKTTRAGGQLGAALPNPVNMRTAIADMMFKYQGWGILGEYFNRKVDGYTLNGSNNNAMLRIPQGQGFNIHVSKMLSRRSEMVIRFAGTEPKKGYEEHIYQYRTKALGYTYYLNKHRVKFQGYFGLDSRYHPEKQSLQYPYKNRVNAMVQVELGI